MLDVLTSKGYAAEALVIADLISKGIVPCKPEIPTTAFDLIAVYDNEIRKIQIKGCTPKEDGKLLVDVRRSKAKDRSYSRESFDVLAVVNLETKEVAYIDYESLGCPSQITLRTSRPNMNGYGKERQPKLFSEFLDFPSKKAPVA
jgi:hypothetical protein